MSNYTFSAAPRAVSGSQSRTRAPRPKYREPEEKTQQILPTPKSNIMFDKRVVRGNTYAAPLPVTQNITPVTQPPRKVARMDSATRRRLAGLPAVDPRTLAAQKTAAAGPGAKQAHHMMVQTDDYLEELVDQIFEQDSGTQTEFVEDLPVPPIFITKPSGVDVGTLIEAGELFDFDLAVEPVLEVIVGKALDQALVEVLEEEEIKRLKEHREKFQRERDSILAEAQRLEAASKRRHEEKERRLQQERERLAREEEVARKAASHSAAKAFLSNLHHTVVDTLVDQGHLYDPVSKQVDSLFMPWLLEQVQTKLNEVALAHQCVDVIFQDAVLSLVDRVKQKKHLETVASQQLKLAEHLALEEAAEQQRQAEVEAARLAQEQAEKEAVDRVHGEGEDEEDEDHPGGEDEEGEGEEDEDV